jgi:hypothetical protein
MPLLLLLHVAACCRYNLQQRLKLDPSLPHH